METYLITVSKYLFIALMLFYTWECFSALRSKNPIKQAGIYQRQNGVIFLVYIIGMAMVFMFEKDVPQINVIILAGAQLCFLIIVLGVFPVIYTNINKAILSNMCMLLTIGFIILARLDYQGSITQFIIVAVVSLLSLIVPYMMQKEDFLKKLTWIYCFVGAALLLIVLAMGVISRGAKLSMEIGGFTFQPSEFVKILFVFFMAGFLAKSTEFKHVVISAILAAVFVGLLVLSTDLGSALIFFMTYLFMLYVATKRAGYLLLGFGGMSVASVIAYFLFSHVQTRVEAWQDPWSIIDGKGYQITQSLFALANGGFTGTGLYQGQPTDIPVVKKDFVFSAIGEEFGGIFAMLLILVCLSCFIAFLISAMKQLSLFNRLICVGLGIQYAVQVILTVGGAIKMIPSTGVTLPLISYGGSSILSTLFVFAIIQGLAIVGTNNEELHMGKKYEDDSSTQKAKKRRKKIEQTQELPKL
ncbi:MAG TPA: FtsW/RodA/SpoVE family cell cycle protein [Eubacterium sp.]|nr:FtsW/RodA/SpoVE family cell cycle protein [Eubacterium sp.]